LRRRTPSPPTGPLSLPRRGLYRPTPSTGGANGLRRAPSRPFLPGKIVAHSKRTPPGSGAGPLRRLTAVRVMLFPISLGKRGVVRPLSSATSDRRPCGGSIWSDGPSPSSPVARELRTGNGREATPPRRKAGPFTRHRWGKPQTRWRSPPRGSPQRDHVTTRSDTARSQAPPRSRPPAQDTTSVEGPALCSWLRGRSGSSLAPRRLRQHDDVGVA
jgi:hypothetical protein